MERIERHERNLDKFGLVNCLEAYRMHKVGEGAFTVACYLDLYTKDGSVNTRRADAMIDAGRYWERRNL